MLSVYLFEDGGDLIVNEVSEENAFDIAHKNTPLEDGAPPFSPTGIFLPTRHTVSS